MPGCPCEGCKLRVKNKAREVRYAEIRRGLARRAEDVAVDPKPEDA